MPLLVPSSERKAGDVRPSSKATHHFLLHREPEAAVGFRDRQAEEAERLHLGHDVGRNGVGLLDPRFVRHQPLAHEARDGVDQCGQRRVVPDHEAFRALCMGIAT